MEVGRMVGSTVTFGDNPLAFPRKLNDSVWRVISRLDSATPGFLTPACRIGTSAAPGLAPRIDHGVAGRHCAACPIVRGPPTVRGKRAASETAFGGGGNQVLVSGTCEGAK